MPSWEECVSKIEENYKEKEITTLYLNFIIFIEKLVKIESSGFYHQVKI